VLANSTAIFERIPDFRAGLLDRCRKGDVERGEVAWSGSDVDGSRFESRGVLIITARGQQICAARSYVEAVDGEDTSAVVRWVEGLRRDRTPAGILGSGHALR
jgi:hypothetical protein